MTAILRLPILASLAIAAGALFSSCTYYPYRYGGSSEVTRSVTYSNNSRTSDSIFIRTSNSRWGYDPHCRSYYDFNRKCYYDPYLRGYYPRGFRPPVITGVPHPHGWRRGMSTCPPPRNVRNHYIKNHRNRYQQYCGLNRPWAHGLKKQHRTPPHSNSIWNRGSHPSHNSHNHHSYRNSHSNRGNQWKRDHSSQRHHANNNGRGHNQHANRSNHRGNANRHANPNRSTNSHPARPTGGNRANPNAGPAPRPGTRLRREG